MRLAMCFVFLLYAGIASATAPPAFTMQFPVDCTVYNNCYIQHYVDVDPTLGAQDYHAGRLTYDGHNGTDIALPNYQIMRAGVAVLASAAGVVLRVRDGYNDYGRAQTGQTEQQACGNGIIIRHPGAWQTQYCHLKMHSITVQPGMGVQAGAKIAQVGSSGKSDYPQLHWSVRKHTQVVDPFKDKLLSKPIIYQETGFIDMATTDHVISSTQALDSATQRVFSLSDNAVITWVRVFGAMAGDQQRFVYIAPNGKVYQQAITSQLPQSFKEWFAYSGYRIAGKMDAALAGQWHVHYYYKKPEHDWTLYGSQSFTLRQ